MPSLSAASSRRLLLAAVALAPAFASAQPAPALIDPYVVTATRTPLPAGATGTAVSTLTAAELARRQVASLRAALGGVPGAPAFASGALGGSTSLFLRGANSNQVLFLVDGIRANDPNTDYAVVLGGACLGACDSLEVAHGPQSTLYGGEAVGGVVALRAARGAGAEQAFALEAGSFGTLQGAVRAQAGDADSAYSFSAAGGRTGNERPNNGFASATHILRLDRRMRDGLEVGATWRGFVGRYGSPGTRFTNDPDNEERESNQLATLFAVFAPAADWSGRVALGMQDRRFVSYNPRPNTATQVTVVRNRRAVLDAQASWTGAPRHRITGGATLEANHTRNTGFGDIDRRQELVALFLQDEFAPAADLLLTAGLRSDDHDTFGRATTGRATAAWRPGGGPVKLRATHGTAFRSPSFLDLYGRSALYAGNPLLRPERARGWDAGLDWDPPGDRGSVGLTWFDTRLRDLIVFDFGASPGTVRNVERARTRGAEVALRYAPSPGAEVRLTYTYLEAANLSQRNRLLRRPRHGGSADVVAELGRGLTVGAGLVFAAEREDVHAATFARIYAEDYVVVRAHLAWTVTPRLTIRARVENLLDERYEEVHGYPQAGRGCFGGFAWRF